MRRQSPEVLSPAGNLETLKVAVDFGADAVYCGGQAFGMRSAPANLTVDDFAEGISYAHERGARIYATCNVLPRNSEVAEMNAYMAELAERGIDAFIVSDIGVMMAARALAPEVDIHISTQAGVTNYQAVEALASLGARRVVLARELSLDDIRTIRRHVSTEIEIEAFVHGSMCMAFSGRCLISQYLTGKDANHGECVQPCRSPFYILDPRRPGEAFGVEEDSQGTFLFNSQDMNLIAHVDEILDAGVTSLKIEGRAKSAYYVAAMTNAYACAVNSYMVQRGYEDSDGQTLRPWPAEAWNPGATQPPAPVTMPTWILDEPMKVTHRDYCTGFYYPQAPARGNTEVGGYINEWRWVATVVDDVCSERMTILSKNKMTPGMAVELLIPGRAPVPWRVPVAGITDEEGHSVKEINNPAHIFSLPANGLYGIRAGTMIRARA